MFPIVNSNKYLENNSEKKVEASEMLPIVDDKYLEDDTEGTIKYLSDNEIVICSDLTNCTSDTVRPELTFKGSADETFLRFNGNINSKTLQKLVDNNTEMADDEIINAYLNVIRIVSDKNILVMSSHYANRVRSLNRNLYQGNLDTFDIVFIPVFVGANHWTIAIFNKTENLVLYCDSFVNLPTNEVIAVINSAVHDLTNGRSHAIIKNLHRDELNVQQDSINCGFFILVFAELYVMNGGVIKLDNFDIIHQRRRILNILKSIVLDKFCYVSPIADRPLSSHVQKTSNLNERFSLKPAEERQRKRRLKLTQEEKNMENNALRLRMYQKRQQVDFVGKESKRRIEYNKKINPSLYMKAHSYNNIVRYKLSGFDVECTACGALHFKEERIGSKTTFFDCCNHGNISLSEYGNDFPEFLKNLFLSRKKTFLDNVRSINCNFSVATLSIRQYEYKTSGPYCFRISGQIYRNFNTSAIPDEGKLPSGGQLFFIDTNDALGIRQKKLKADPNDISNIHKYLVNKYSYAQSYVMMREEMANQEAISNVTGEKRKEIKLFFNSKTGKDPRRYNLPVNNEIAAVFVEGEGGTVPQAHITVHERGKQITNLPSIDPNVEPMLYPLFKPNGEKGWNINMSMKNGGKLTHCDYIYFHLHYRKNKNNDNLPYQFNPLHYGGKLTQQWIVERWCCIESERLLFIRLHQNKIKASSYNGLQDWLSNRQNRTGAALGRQIILPSTYTGAPRYMLNNYNDAMCMCAEFGVPDLFITMTCDPTNPDILNNVPKGDSANNHPMLCNRVFKLQCDKLLEVLNCADKKKGGIFGRCITYCYTIEFQKRGLPHMHLLLTLDSDGKQYLRENIDDILSARVCLCGDQNCFINNRMVHGPCGIDNLNAPCMKHALCTDCSPKPKHERLKNCDTCESTAKYCSKGFPKQYCKETDISAQGYAKLKRPEHESVTVNGKTINNSMIVPHSPYLVNLTGSHVNVEKVDSLKSVKYLFKYVNKGSDAAMLDVVKVNEDDTKTIIYDETNRHLDARYVGPYEGAWHLAKFPMQSKRHHIEALPVHLKERHTVYFKEEATDEEMCNAMEKNTKLTAFFEYCKNHSDEKITYRDFPKTKTWNGKAKEWKEREAHFDTLGRIYTVSPADGELFYLRLLLNNVESPTSYENLYEFEGEVYESYAKACLARGLIKGNDEYMKIIEEACLSKFPKHVRSLYALILIHCNPPEPEEIWEKFKMEMSEDFNFRYKNSDVAIELAYASIVRKLLNYGKDLDSDYPTMPKIDLNVIEKKKNMLDAGKHAQIAEEMEKKMNADQRKIYDKIKHIFNNPTVTGNKCFFVDGPGGTGKTFIYKTVYHLAISMNKKIENTAFSGIAATLLPKGKTNHYLFKLPVPLMADSSSRIELNSPEGKRLYETDIIVWDEAPMSSKHILEIADRTLRAIMSNNIPFRGKIMLLGGDFRQILPVKKNARNAEDVISICLKTSFLWKRFEIINLTENKRADPDAKQFAKEILDIGNGTCNDVNDLISVPNECVLKKSLHEEVFGDCISKRNWENMSNRAIMAPKNVDVTVHNNMVLNMLPGDECTYTSVDEAANWKGPALPAEVLQRFTDPGFSPPVLKLKTNAVVILLRNLNIDKGLCNGTRMRVLKMGERLLTCEIITGDKKGKVVLIPRITLIDDTHFSCELHRHQFPVKLAFAMSINKAQGQTFKNIGIDLSLDVFSHGQLYVAISRTSSWKCVKILLRKSNVNNKVKNIVWKQVLA